MSIPQVGQSDATEDPKVASDFTTLQATIDGGLDATNISAGLAQSATVNQSGQVVKGSANIGSTGTRTSSTYGFLNDANDQVSGIVLPTNGLIAVWYQALWSVSGTGTAAAGLFLGANEVQLAGPANTFSPVEVQIAASVQMSHLCTGVGGLYSEANTGTTSTDVTTGQLVGLGPTSAGASTHQGPGAGPCYIFAVAGTYNVSVQFKVLTGAPTISAQNRKLWVQALSFA